MALVYSDQHKHTLSLHNHHTKGSNINFYFYSELPHLAGFLTYVSSFCPAPLAKRKVRDKVSLMYLLSSLQLP